MPFVLAFKSCILKVRNLVLIASCIEPGILYNGGTPFLPHDAGGRRHSVYPPTCLQPTRPAGSPARRRTRQGTARRTDPGAHPGTRGPKEVSKEGRRRRAQKIPGTQEGRGAEDQVRQAQQARRGAQGGTCGQAADEDSSSQRALLRAAAVPEGPEPHAEPDGAAPVRRRQDRECVRRWAHGRQGDAAVRAEGAEETLARRHRNAEGGGTKVRGAKESPRIRRGARAFVRGEAQEGHVRAHRRVWASTLRSPRPQEDHDGDDEGYILTGYYDICCREQSSCLRHHEANHAYNRRGQCHGVTARL
ncbi:uncharacterized protein LOC119594250 [Penaeus monodon]|uniref:uncharacterized protein LOC119594250 n=1 Tax=Penaeus monodon TaxID=6687 RepID=UPI0018A6E2EB|nr:uncharacterized protein LOC119594250 [Penaeus monodon]